MAQNPQKLVYPTGADLFQPHRDIKALADSATVIVPVANRTEADAIASTFNPSPSKPLYVDRADTGALERNRGNGWTIVGSEHSPFRMAVGRATVTATASSGGSTEVTFPSGRFTTTPYVLVARASGGAAKYIPYSTSVTPTGCNIAIFSGDGTSSTQTAVVNWWAIQMLPTSAEG